MVNEDGSLPSIDGSHLLNLPIGSGDMEKATYDPANKNAQLAALTDLAVDTNLSAAAQDAITKRHANTLDHSNSLDHDGSAQDTTIAAKETPSGAQTKVDTHTALTTGVHGAGASTLATAATLATAVSDHAGAADPHTGYRLESADHTHQSAGTQAGQLDHGLALTGLTDDDHTQYQLESEKGAVNGYAPLDAGGLVDGDDLPALSATKKGGAPMTGTPSNKYLRDDGTWQSPPGGSEAFPVGSVFISVVATNPATLLGYGTWSAIAAGRVLVGLDSGDTDFDTVEETGGAKTVQASAQTFAGTPSTVIVNHVHVQNLPTGQTGGQSSGTRDTSTTGSGADALSTANPTGGAASYTPAGANTPGAATSVVQPYFVVYMWKRTV